MATFLEAAEIGIEAGILPREMLFVKHYLQTFSASEAAYKAGYRNTNTGYDLLKRPKVRAMVLEGMKDDGMTPAEIIARLTRMARASMGDFVTVDSGGFARVDLQKAEQAGALGLIQELSYDANGMPKIKLCSVKDALDSLAKIHAMFTERVQIDSSTRIDLNVNAQVMTAAMADPALLAQLGELAEAVRASNVKDASTGIEDTVPAPVEVRALPTS